MRHHISLYDRKNISVFLDTHTLSTTVMMVPSTTFKMSSTMIRACFVKIGMHLCGVLEGVPFPIVFTMPSYLVFTRSCYCDIFFPSTCITIDQPYVYLLLCIEELQGM